MASQQNSKTALVTGANQGIGFGCCCQLANKGYNLVLACRNEDNAKKAVKIIQDEHPSIVVEYVLVDLASLQSVQECIQTLLKKGQKLDVIVLNAAVCRPAQLKTIDGYDTTFQVNYLSQYLLAQHLINNNQSHPIKIVTLTSIMYNIVNWIRLPNKSSKWLPMLNNSKQHQLKAYSQSKFACALLSQAFNQQQNVTATSVHPGIAPTSMFQSFSFSKVGRKIARKILKDKIITVQDSASNVVLSIVTDIPEGQYNCAGKIMSLNKKTRCQQNLKHLIEMNKQLMEKHGISQ